MATRAYRDWRNAGSPWSPATPIADFSRTMRGHGYTVYILGADDPTHLQANLPEDHCPFSQTPWPGRQPYPRVLALDIMPGGEMDWRALGEKIVADKNAGVPGTEWIKYINYEDRAGNCWHASWQPNYARRPSSDRGHLHISGRTDYVDAHTAYDPLGESMAGEADKAFSAPYTGVESFVSGKSWMAKAVELPLREVNRKLDALGKAGGAMSPEQYADFKAAMLAAIPSKEDIADVLIARAAGK